MLCQTIAPRGRPTHYVGGFGPEGPAARSLLPVARRRGFGARNPRPCAQTHPSPWQDVETRLQKGGVVVTMHKKENNIWPLRLLDAERSQYGT